MNRLVTFSEPTTNETLRPQRRFTTNDKTALGDDSKELAPMNQVSEPETLEKVSKEQTEEAIKDRSMALWTEGKQEQPSQCTTELNMEKTASRSQGDVNQPQPREKQANYSAVRDWEMAELKSLKSAVQGDIQPQKCRQGRQQASKDRCFELEDVKSQLLVENEALVGEFAKLSQTEEQETSEEQCAALEKDIKALRRQNTALEDEIQRAKSRQVSEDALKQRRAQLEAEKHHLCSRNKALEDQLEEMTRKTDPQSSIKQFSELEMETEALKRQTGVLQEEIQQAKTKLEQQASMKQQLLQLEGVRDGLREEKEAALDELTQLCEKLEPDVCLELCVKRANVMERQVVVLRGHTGVLLGELEQAKARLQQQTSLKEHCVELEAESRHLQDENEKIRREISQTFRRLAEEKSCEQNLKTAQEMKRVLEEEKEQLLKHKQKLEKGLDAERLTSFGYKQQLLKIDDMRRQNIDLQQDVDKLVTDIRNHKSAQENSKDMAKTDAQVKAKNKQLCKNLQRLHEELQKLRPLEVETENFDHDLDDLRQENIYLHQKILALNQEVTSKKMLQVRLKSMKAEREWMLQRRRGLNLEISWLTGVHREQLSLREEKKKLDEENTRLQQQNRQLSRKMEDLFVEALRNEVHQV